MTKNNLINTFSLLLTKPVMKMTVKKPHWINRTEKQTLFSIKRHPSCKEVSVYFNNWSHLHRPLLLDYSPSLLAWWYSFRRVFDNAAAAGCSWISLGITQLDELSRIQKKKPATFLTTGSGSENGRNESFQCSSIVLPGFFPNHLCFGLYRVDHNDHGITVKRTVFGNVTTPTSFKCNNLYIAFLTIS